jgi:hypothetical protein
MIELQHREPGSPTGRRHKKRPQNAGKRTARIASFAGSAAMALAYRTTAMYEQVVICS